MSLSNTGIFTATYIPINLKANRNHLFVIPFGDIHFGAEHHADKHFAKFIREHKRNKYARYLGMGDYFDFASYSEREHLAKTHDSTQDKFDVVTKAEIRAFVKRYPHLVGNTLGLVEGNHYYRFRDGSTSTQYLAELLHCKYLGAMALIKLGIKVGNSHFNYDICAYHGGGACILFGGSINRVVRMANGVNADLYLQGHDHHVGVTSNTQIFLKRHAKLKEPIVCEKVQHFCRTGSFLKAFVNNRPSYIADRGGNARTLGGVMIELSITRTTHTHSELVRKVHQYNYGEVE